MGGFKPSLLIYEDMRPGCTLATNIWHKVHIFESYLYYGLSAIISNCHSHTDAMTQDFERDIKKKPEGVWNTRETKGNKVSVITKDFVNT